MRFYKLLEDGYITAIGTGGGGVEITEKVHYPTKDDPVYESLLDYNIYSPDAYPAGWKLLN